MGGFLRLLLLAVAIWLIISGVRRLFLLSSFPRWDKEEVSMTQQCRECESDRAIFPTQRAILREGLSLPW